MRYNYLLILIVLYACHSTRATSQKKVVETSVIPKAEVSYNIKTMIRNFPASSSNESFNGTILKSFSPSSVYFDTHYALYNDHRTGESQEWVKELFKASNDLENLLHFDRTSSQPEAGGHIFKRFAFKNRGFDAIILNYYDGQNLLAMVLATINDNGNVIDTKILTVNGTDDDYTYYGGFNMSDSTTFNSIIYKSFADVNFKITQVLKLKADGTIERKSLKNVEQ